MRAALVSALAAIAAAATTTHSLGALLNITCSGASCDLTASVDGSSSTVPLRLSFYAPQIVRYWLAVDGNFSDIGAAADVIVGGAAPVVAVLRDAGSYYEVTQAAPPPVAAVVARVNKSPLLLSLLVDGAVVAAEAAPLSFNDTSSWQTLARDTAPLAANLTREWFFGGGMQHGRFSHRDQEITLGVDYNWDDNGHPNSVPFYISTAGYGVLRNTWAPGTYRFASPVVTVHNESTRFDAFYMLAGAGPASIKTVLGMYTAMTGPPFLPPIYGLFLGDSDCMHDERHGNSTRVAIAIAALYDTYDMPRGWMLPNDGYGCGYGEGPVSFPHNISDLTYVVEQLHTHGMTTGLWTSTGMPYIKQEVGVAGTRIGKTDVGWIGSGYKYAFDGVGQCVSGIEENSSGRRFVWTVEGWAGTHRMAVMWTGDNSGSLNYTRWQIPSFTGAGFSAQAHVSGDIDGIFGGSPESQVRDLQFKALTTALMTMSGWAPNPDKQPWTWGEPFTTYNRAALKLKSQLTPYVYSACREAYDTGVPPVRAPLLEFPRDEALFGPDVAAYEFMTGASLLAAPVFVEGAVTRDGIYLPAGADWADYWTGAVFAGGQTLDAYPAPLDVLPLFARAGAIIPMWPPTNTANVSAADPMTLDLWPSGASAFELYEDDGVTRDALPPTSAFARTAISVAAPAGYLNGTSAANVTVSVSAAAGAFAGQLASRGWRLNIRSRAPPLVVELAAAGAPPAALPEMQSEAELEAAAAGWFFDAYVQRGLLLVKVPAQNAADAFAVTLSNGPSFAHIGTEACDTPTHRQVENQKFAFDAGTGLITVLAAAGAGAAPPQCLTVGADKDPDSHTAAAEVQECAAALSDRQQFAVVAASNQIALKADASTCLDQDVSDFRVITYGCHDPAQPGNQAWRFDSATAHIVSQDNGLCMCVLPA